MSRTSRSRALKRGMLAVAASVALVLSGCAGGGAGGSSTSEAGTLTVISAMDAAPNQLFRSGYWFTPVLEPLFRQDKKTGEPIPVLAEDWTQSEDLTAISVTIKNGITFHDGRDLTIDDVVFSFQQALLPENNSGAASVAANVAAVDATGDNELTITFNSPTSNMWDLLYFTPVLDPTTFDGIADGSTVNGTGPYTWVSWDPGKELVLEKYGDYRDADRAHYDTIDAVVLTDPTAQQSAMRSGRGQLGVAFSSQDASVLADTGDFQAQQVAVATLGMGLNTSVAPFDDPAVRQAVGYAIDRERLLEQASAGIGEPISLWWGQQYPGWDAEQNDYYSYDPDKARKMVEAAGAVGAEIPLIFPTSALFQSFYEIIAAGLTDAGFVPSAHPIENNEAVDRLLRGDLGTGYILIDSAIATMSPSTVMDSTPMFITGEKSPQKFEDPEYDRLRAQVQATTGDEQVAVMHELNDYLLTTAFNLAVVNFPNLTVVDNSIDTSGSDVFTVSGALTGLDIRPAD